MTQTHAQPDRETQAKLEIGVTALSRAQGWLLLGLFLAVMLVPPLVQAAWEYRQGAREASQSRWPRALRLGPLLTDPLAAWRQAEGGWYSKVMAANAAALRRIRQFEADLEDHSLLGQAVRGPTQSLLCRLGAGNEKAYMGRDGWLFYRPDVDYVTGPGFLDARQLARRAAKGDEVTGPPQPDPVRAILHFRDQLAARGIALILLPTPLKASVHPEQYGGSARPARAVQNASFAEFLARMQRSGVPVLDPGDMLARLAAVPGEARFHYLRTDTHWTPQAMDQVAGELARLVSQRVELSAAAPAGYRERSLNISHLGDIAAMLKLPAGQSLYLPETARIQQVTDAQGAPLRPSRQAEVLVLGDSFSNIYALEAMGWGAGAGLVERLAFHLQRPVDAILRNDRASFATRQMLRADLARGSNRLAGKKVVIWQFAARELSEGDWKLIDLPTVAGATRPADTQPIAPVGGARDPEQDPVLIAKAGSKVRGRIAAVTRPPKPFSVPYADARIALHLTGVDRVAGPTPPRQMLVYAWGMRGHVWTAAARWEVGQTVELELLPWDAVGDHFGQFNAAELDDLDLQSLPTYWALTR